MKMNLHSGRWLIALSVSIVAVAASGAFGSASILAARHPSRGQRITLCYPSTATSAQRMRQAKIVKERIESYKLTAHTTTSPAGCEVAHLTQPISWLRILAGDLKERGWLSLTVDVPAIKQRGNHYRGGTPLSADQKVRFAGDPITRLNRREPVVKVVVPSWDIVSGSAAIDHPNEGNPLVAYSLDSNGAKAWCAFTTKRVNFTSPVVLDRRVLVSPFIEDPICASKNLIPGIPNSRGRFGPQALVNDINLRPLPVAWKSVRVG
jgi:hypothetical protein